MESQAFLPSLPVHPRRPRSSLSVSTHPSSTCPRRPRTKASHIYASSKPPADGDTPNEDENQTISWLLSTLAQRSNRKPPASDPSKEASDTEGDARRADDVKTTEVPGDAADDSASPTIASLLAALPLSRGARKTAPVQRDGGGDVEEGRPDVVPEQEARREGVQASVSWMLSALAQRSTFPLPGAGEQPTEKAAVEKGSDTNADGDDDREEGVNAAISWLLSAVARKRSEEGGKVETKSEEDELLDVVRGKEEDADDVVEMPSQPRDGESELLTQSDARQEESKANGNGARAAMSWLLDMVSEKMESGLQSRQLDDIKELAPDTAPETNIVPETRLSDATAKEAENQLVSWLSSKLRPDATKEEVMDQTMSWLSSKMGSATETLPALALQEMLQRGSDVATELSQQAMMATLRALNVEPFDSTEHADDPTLPRRPYDPVHALALAGYSFRAYLDPPTSSYRETFAVAVDGSQLSGLDRQLVYTDFVYPNTVLISRRAKGAFMLQVTGSEGLEGEFVVAEINGALVLDLLKKRHCVVLCQRDPPSSRFRTIGDADVDQLVVSLFPSEQAYDEGTPPTDFASFSLAELVQQGLESGVYVEGEACEMSFQKVSNEEKNKDFFHFSLLPSEMNLSFPFQSMVEDSPDADAESVGSASIAVHVSFIPFVTGPEGTEMEEVSSMLANAEATSFRSMTSNDEEVSLDNVLTSELTPGQMPIPGDWSRLTEVVRSLVARVGSDMRIQRTSTVTENLPGALFIESLATDTEVWLFHDEVNRDIVISFRGTEQVSWKDFFTDAQLFLQRWAPGEEIDLNVEINRTVGLTDFIPNMLPTPKSSIPEDASAVHYGFLRAYLSIRDALLRGIEMLSSDLAEGYSFHFTGHSLGGALAIIAASDFQARHLFDDWDVSCMSYGAPKAGNVPFAAIYNKLVPNSFRVVNDSDLVARMPRSLSGSAPVNRYQHAGRTVLINNSGDYWIEGYQPESLILTKMSSIQDPFRERYKNLQDLMAFEQNLWSELISGRSVQHHMVSILHLYTRSKYPVAERTPNILTVPVRDSVLLVA